MFKLLLSLALFLAPLQTQSVVSSTPFIRMQMDFTIDDIVGDYYLAGTINTSNQLLFENFDSGRCFKSSIRVLPDGVVTVGFQFFDTVRNSETNTLSRYIYDPNEPTILRSELDYIFNFKFYTGDNDLIITFYPSQNEVVLKKRDGTVGYFLSGKYENSQDMDLHYDEAKCVGFDPDHFTAVNNTNCL